MEDPELLLLQTYPPSPVSSDEFQFDLTPFEDDGGGLTTTLSHSSRFFCYFDDEEKEEIEEDFDHFLTPVPSPVEAMVLEEKANANQDNLFSIGDVLGAGGKIRKRPRRRRGNCVSSKARSTYQRKSRDLRRSWFETRRSEGLAPSSPVRAEEEDLDEFDDCMSEEDSVRRLPCLNVTITDSSAVGNVAAVVGGEEGPSSSVVKTTVRIPILDRVRKDVTSRTRTVTDKKIEYAALWRTLAETEQQSQGCVASMPVIVEDQVQRTTSSSQSDDLEELKKRVDDLVKENMSLKKNSSRKQLLKKVEQVKIHLVDAE